LRGIWNRVPNAPLLKRDGEHPTALGSFAVALSIFTMLYSRTPEGLPAQVRLRNKGVAEAPAELFPVIQESVAEANERYGKR
jgi:hypothetical protein